MESERKLFSLIVRGQPVGKPRPKATVVGGHARVYTPSAGQRYEYMVREAFLTSHPQLSPSRMPLRVEIKAFFGLNKADYDSKGNPNKSGRAKLSGARACAKKPDFDNIAKIVVDALNGIAWADDCQIVSASVSKRYDDVPRVEVTAYEIEAAKE